MRRTKIVLMVFVGLGAAAAAPAQDLQIVRSALPPTTPAATADHVIRRLMSFDRDRDGKVQKTELIERMQPIVATGDTDGDGALDGLEIRAVAVSGRTAAARTVPFGGGTYRIPESTFFSSRAHIEGLVADLKLDADAHTHALEVIAAHEGRVKAAQEKAFGALRYDVLTVLTPEQLSHLETAARQQHAPFTIHQRVTSSGSVRRVFLGVGSGLRDVVEHFALPPAKMQQTRAAVARYETTLDRSGAEEKAELLDQLSRVLGNDDLESFRASLDRRSAVPTPLFLHDVRVVTGAVVSGVVVGGSVHPLPARGVTSAAGHEDRDTGTKREP